MGVAAAARRRLRRSAGPYDRRDDFFSEYSASDVLARLEAGDEQGAAITTAALLQRYGVEVAPKDLEESRCNDVKV